jgi:hypothetical protein
MIGVTTLSREERVKLKKALERIEEEATKTYAITLKIVVKETRSDDLAEPGSAVDSIVDVLLPGSERLVVLNLTFPDEE